MNDEPNLANAMGAIDEAQWRKLDRAEQDFFGLYAGRREDEWVFGPVRCPDCGRSWHTRMLIAPELPDDVRRWTLAQRASIAWQRGYRCDDCAHRLT